MTKSEIIRVMLGIGIIGVFVTVVAVLFIAFPLPFSTVKIDPESYTMNINQDNNTTTVDIVFKKGMELRAGNTYQIDLTPVIEQWEKSK